MDKTGSFYVLFSTELRYRHYVCPDLLGVFRTGCDDLGTKLGYRWNNTGVIKHKMPVAPSLRTNQSLARGGGVMISALTWHPS